MKKRIAFKLTLSLFFGLLIVTPTQSSEDRQKTSWLSRLFKRKNKTKPITETNESTPLSSSFKPNITFNPIFDPNNIINPKNDPILDTFEDRHDSYGSTPARPIDENPYLDLVKHPEQVPPVMEGPSQRTPELKPKKSYSPDSDRSNKSNSSGSTSSLASIDLNSYTSLYLDPMHVITLPDGEKYAIPFDESSTDTASSLPIKKPQAFHHQISIKKPENIHANPQQTLKEAAKARLKEERDRRRIEQAINNPNISRQDLHHALLEEGGRP